jgi:hypothetical protein
MSSEFVLNTSKLDEGRLGPFIYVTANAELGSIAATTTTKVTHLVTAIAPLGQMEASATARIDHQATAQALLGILNASANTQVDHPAIATATLGTLDANARVSVDQYATASAEFGSLQANAITAQQTTQIAAITGSPHFVNPTVITGPQINKAEALALTQWGGMKIQAISRIDFSVLQDDAELLLLI